MTCFLRRLPDACGLAGWPRASTLSTSVHRWNVCSGTIPHSRARVNAPPRTGAAQPRPHAGAALAGPGLYARRRRIRTPARPHRAAATTQREVTIANAADGTPGAPAPPKIAAVIAAHPDDPDFGAGGTAALWTRQGWEFHYIVVTNGAKGSDDPTMTRDRLIAAREQEQRACAAVLGVSSCAFLGGEDGELDYSRAMLGKIVREIRRLKPLAVFTHSDQIIHRRPGAVDADEAERFVGFINHRDHRNTGAMAVDAVYPTARDHMNFPEQIREEGLETHKVSQVYIWGHPEANFHVDITDSVERKLSGLMEHKTQFGSRGDAFTSGMRERFRDTDGRFYERFLRVDLPS